MYIYIYTYKLYNRGNLLFMTCLCMFTNLRINKLRSLDNSMSGYAGRGDGAARPETEAAQDALAAAQAGGEQRQQA